MGTVNIRTHLHRHMRAQQDQDVRACINLLANVAEVSPVYTIEAGVCGDVQVWLLAVYIYVSVCIGYWWLYIIMYI